LELCQEPAYVFAWAFGASLEKGPMGKLTMFAAALTAYGVLAIAGEATADPRTHDGFQFRGTVGPGYLSTSTSQNGGDVSFKGLSGNLDIYLGGTPARGLVVGGTLNWATAFGPSVTFNGQSVNGAGNNTLSLLTVGPYVNYYLDPTQGLYFLGMIGYGAESYTQNGVSESSPGGPAFALGAGYDLWVSDEWSLGVLGRFTYASLSVNRATYSTISPAIMFSFNYH
jgi:hypothetical protein